MTTAINYLHGEISPDQEAQALHNLCAYLVSKGQYRDEAAAVKDAEQRVSFLEKNDVYVDDARLADASWNLRATEALIAAHNLEPVLKENGGELPGSKGASEAGDTGGDTGQPASPAPSSEVQAAPAASAGKRARVSERSATEIFASVESDLRRGLSREQVITRLEDTGLSTANAAEAYEFVLAQRRKKQQARLWAILAVVGLSVAFFFLSRFFI